jgi:putative ABC transport system permease protein
MSLKECVRLSLRNVSLNRLRSVLTMLGIIIGVSAVITITTIGASLEKTILSSMQSIGNTNLIYCSLVDQPEEGEEYTGASQEFQEGLSLSMLETLQATHEETIEAIVLNTGGMQATCPGLKKEQQVYIFGATTGYVNTAGMEIIAGRDISRADNDQRKATAVVSDTFIKAVFGTGVDPLGEKIVLQMTDSGKALELYIVGVYHMRSSLLSGGSDTTTVLIPYSVFNSSGIDPYSDADHVWSFQVLAGESEDPEAVAAEISSWLKERYFRDSSVEIMTESMASALDQIHNVLQIVTIAISVIAGISLLVGGVGVMNIMLVSVVERTREIGIRKAVGAKSSSIRMQFLIESVVICLIGGLIGILFGVLNGYLFSSVGASLLASATPELANMVEIIVTPSLSAMLISFGFCALIGILFGLYPANRAAKMSPIDALRYE